MNINEKTTDRITVPECMYISGHRGAIKNDCSWSLSGRQTAKEFFRIAGHKQGRSISSSKKSLGITSEPNTSNRVCQSHSDIASSQGISSRNMGRRSQETARGTEKMKVISAANQKGGVGKTNFIVHLAHDFIERGLKVLVLDTDPQGNASFSLSAYASKVTASQFFDDKPIALSPKDGITLVTGDPKMLNIEKLNISDVGDNLKRNLKSVSEQFDVCLIDTAPTLGVRLASVMYASDYVFTPIEVEAYSMLGVSLMRKTIANMSQLNPSLVNLGLIASRVDKRNPLHVRNFDSLKSNHADQLVPVVIGQRSSFGVALHSKVPVWNIKKTSARVAAKEMRDFAEYVFNKVELTND